MTTGSEGLRERKKQRTRQAIVQAALRLFAERGFEATTIADIAAAADIAPRTFFGYFRSKEDVVFDDFEATSESLAARLREREPGETAVDALRAWIEALLADADWHDELELCRRRLVTTTPVLAAHERGLMARFEEILATAVAADLGDEPGALRPRMVAAAATAALLSTESYFKDEDESVDRRLLEQDALRVVEDTLAFLRGGLAALQARGGE